jgi:ribonuclease BN (tRNA processing enzyme)
LDHILDLGALRYLALYNPVPIARRIPLHVPPDSSVLFARWGAAFSEEDDFFDPVFAFSEYDPDRPLTVGSLTIRFARTKHPVPAWAMRVSGTGTREFGYTADTGPTCDLSEFLRGVSLLASEATEPADTRASREHRGHMTAAEAADLAERADVKALLLTHRWEELGLDRAAAEAGAGFRGPIMVAAPGLTVFI